MSDNSQPFSPFYTPKEIEHYLSPAVNNLLHYHWKRILKAPWVLLHSLLTKDRFFKFWRELLKEMCIANNNITTISVQTKIPAPLLEDLCYGANTQKIIMTVENVEQLIKLHQKIRPDLQPAIPQEQLS